MEPVDNDEFFDELNKRKGNKSELNDLLSCEYLCEDGSCGEPDYACCIEWVNWQHRRFDKFEPAETFCKLSKTERNTYRETAR